MPASSRCGCPAIGPRASRRRTARSSTRSAPSSRTASSMGETLAIIPARGGSKRVEGKNLYVVAGRPLVAHSVAHALAAEEVDEVVVSTEDPEIARVARDAGAGVVERPAELAGDGATS